MRKSSKASKRPGQKATQNQLPPQWLEESMSQPICAPENFRIRREHILRMSTQQCADWLRVHRTTIGKWENGKERIPFAAYEAMRLLYESKLFSRQHDKWQGWKFTKLGELVNPDGTMIFTPGRLVAVVYEFLKASRLESENASLVGELSLSNTEIERLRTENIQLRQMAAADAMVDELHSIKDRVESLLSLVGRAKVCQFPEGQRAA